VAVDEHPSTFVTVTVYVLLAGGESVIAAVEAPVLHKKPLPPDAVSVALEPAQIILSLMVDPELSVSVITAFGKDLTVINVEAVDEQLLASVIVRVKLVFVVGVVFIDDVTAPVLHKYVNPAGAVSVAFSPEQIILSLVAKPELSVSDIDAVGKGLTTTCTVAEQVAAPLSVMVTVYVVVIFGVTVINEVAVTPVLHKKVTPPDAINVA